MEKKKGKSVVAHERWVKSTFKLGCKEVKTPVVVRLSPFECAALIQAATENELTVEGLVNHFVRDGVCDYINSPGVS